MRKILPLLALTLILSGCSFFHVHEMDIKQGNMMTPEMQAKIHRGMTEEQVKDILGEPLLMNVFDANRMDYVYTFRAGNAPMEENKMILVFRKGRLEDIR